MLEGDFLSPDSRHLVSLVSSSLALDIQGRIKWLEILFYLEVHRFRVENYFTESETSAVFGLSLPLESTFLR